MDDDDIVDAELIGDGDDPAPRPLIPADTILTPCHHGCTCGLHQEVLYGERVPPHPPTDLDHGEMGLLVEAVADATRMLNGFHDHFRKLRATATQTYSQAGRALRDFAASLTSDELRRACAERDQIEESYADLGPDQRQATPRWLKAITIFAIAGMVVFDAYFFQQIFLNILQISLNDPWWKREIGLVAAVVMAIGTIAAGRILAGPIWRLGRHWRRPASPDEPPPRRIIRVVRVVAVGAAPAAIFFVLGSWATFRGQSAVVAELNANNNTTTPLPVPASYLVMLLLLSLALTVIVLEVLVYNPYQAQLKRSEKTLARIKNEITAKADAAVQAVEAHEVIWRDLRSARDEVIAFVHAELARPWQNIILPARLRHGKAGPKAAKAKYGVKIELASIDENGNGTAHGNGISNGNGAHHPGADQVEITYQIFDGMTQPQPGSGPLAEVVRTVLELDPGPLKKELRRLEQRAHTQLAEPAQPPPDQPAPDQPDPEQPGEDSQ
jgi:hypothetical protein